MSGGAHDQQVHVIASEHRKATQGVVEKEIWYFSAHSGMDHADLILKGNHCHTALAGRTHRARAEAVLKVGFTLGKVRT